MVELKDARAMLAPEQEEKVAKIFGKFDEDKDGVLRRVSIVYLGLHTVCTVFMFLLFFGCKILGAAKWPPRC